MSVRVISIKDGKIRGIKEKSTFSGVEYYSFYGVPYGQSTANKFRFKDPVRVKPWKNVYDATNEKTGCAQYSLHVFQFMGDEDCLYTNIYTPQLPTRNEPLKPVIVNIHPGAFFFGAPEKAHYGSPNYVIHNDVVYVCIAYRLHILGFLNLGLEECSGNQAFKDIVMGLQWIRDNIHFFGGDPENVTLLGSSSGAVAVHLLMLSPAAKGLFHKAIIMGGYGFNPVIYCKEENETDAFNIAQQLGYKGKLEDKLQLLSFFKKVPAQKLVQQVRQYEKEYNAAMNIAPIYIAGLFVPAIDSGEQAVLPIVYKKLIASMARIPILFGMCEKEAVLGFSHGHLRTCSDKNFRTSFRQNQQGWTKNISDEELQIINKEIESFYLEGQCIESASLSTKIDIQTDAGFSDLYETLLDPVAVDLPSSVYVYKFQYEGNMPTIKTAMSLVLDEQIPGTFHASDFSYWNQYTSIMEPVPERCKYMIRTFTKLITTFARNGNPNFEGMTEVWRPSTLDHPCYLSINNTLKMVDGRLNGERMKFWDDLKKRLKKL